MRSDDDDDNFVLSLNSSREFVCLTLRRVGQARISRGTLLECKYLRSISPHSVDLSVIEGEQTRGEKRI